MPGQVILYKKHLRPALFFLPQNISVALETPDIYPYAFWVLCVCENTDKHRRVQQSSFAGNSLNNERQASDGSCLHCFRVWWRYRWLVFRPSEETISCHSFLPRCMKNSFHGARRSIMTTIAPAFWGLFYRYLGVLSWVVSYCYIWVCLLSITLKLTGRDGLLPHECTYHIHSFHYSL